MNISYRNETYNEGITMDDITISETWKILEAYTRDDEIVYAKWKCSRFYNGEEVPFAGEFVLAIPVPANSDVSTIVDAIKLTLGDDQLNDIIKHNENYIANILYKKTLGSPYLVDAEEVRNTRDMKLLQSDWTVLPDNSLTAEQKELWAQYRQQLRDIPQQPDFPNNVVWPSQPS